MVSKVFLDINIVIDFFEPARPDSKNAQALFELMENGNVKGYISEAILATTSYLLRREFAGKKMRQLMFEILDLCKVLSCTHHMAIECLKFESNEFEDALLYQIALHNNMDYFISNDQGFSKFAMPHLPVLTTKDFLKVI